MRDVRKILTLVVVGVVVAFVVSALPGSAARDRVAPVIGFTQVTPYVTGGTGGFVGVSAYVTDNVGVVAVTASFAGPAPSVSILGSVAMDLLAGTPSDGAWNGTFVFPLSALQGSYTMTVTASDKAGNVATAIDGETYLDATPPSILGFDHAAFAGPDSWFNVRARVADDLAVQSVAASFLGPDGASTLVGIAGLYLYYGTSQEGNWTGSFLFPGADVAPQGTYQVVLQASDSAGNTVSVPAGSVYLDRTPPDTFVVSAVDGVGKSVSDGGRTRSNTITFTLSGTDDSGIGGFYCQLDSGGFFMCGSPRTFTDLARGVHTFQVYAFDNAGLVDPTPATFTWRVR